MDRQTFVMTCMLSFAKTKASGSNCHIMTVGTHLHQLTDCRNEYTDRILAGELGGFGWWRRRFVFYNRIRIAFRVKLRNTFYIQFSSALRYAIVISGFADKQSAILGENLWDNQLVCVSLVDYL